MSSDKDITGEILLRLPLKSLVRCKSLSKEWKEFITSNKDFGRNYLLRGTRGNRSIMVGLYGSVNRASRGPNPLRFLPTSAEGRTTEAGRNMLRKRKLNGGEGEGEEENDIHIGVAPLIPPDVSLSFLGGHQSPYILGSSNGYLLCSREQKNPMSYFICNPMNKHWVALPNPEISSPHRFFIHGFICQTTPHCLDIAQSYKVVRAVCSKPNVFSTSLTIEICSPQVPDRWELVHLKAPFPFYLNCFISSAVMSEEGVIYFLGFFQRQTAQLKAKPCLIYFNNRKEGHLQLLEYPPTKGTANDRFDLSDGSIRYAHHNHKLGLLTIWTLNGLTREWSLTHKVSFHFTMQQYPDTIKSKTEQIFSMKFHPLNPGVLFLSTYRRILSCDVENLRLELVCHQNELKQGQKLVYWIYPYTVGLIGLP